jgi:dihydroorotate dehydrogenase electron transfer subunit
MSNSMAEARRVKVVRLTRPTRYHYRLDLEAPVIAERAVPGQFVMVRPLPDTTDPLLGRPLAVLDTDVKAGTFALLFMISGRGTSILTKVKPGDEVYVNGPLGKGFSHDRFDEIAAVGGGTGVAPLYFLVKEAKAAGKKVHLVLGARSAELLPRLEILQPSETLHCATDDGSFGFKGTAVDAFRQCVEDHVLAMGRGTGVFTAGPIPMMKALAAMAKKMKAPLQASLESRMGCGIGVCRGCVIPALTPHPLYGFKQRAVCYDGPVFDAAEIDWDSL